MRHKLEGPRALGPQNTLIPPSNFKILIIAPPEEITFRVTSKLRWNSYRIQTDQTLNEEGTGGPELVQLWSDPNGPDENFW